MEKSILERNLLEVVKFDEWEIRSNLSYDKTDLADIWILTIIADNTTTKEKVTNSFTVQLGNVFFGDVQKMTGTPFELKLINLSGEKITHIKQAENINLMLRKEFLC